MSLPLALGTTIETIPAAIPYLHPDQAKAASWRSHLCETPGLLVGVVWAGNPRTHNRQSVVAQIARDLQTCVSTGFIAPAVS
jgi:hypothetical protein